MERLTIKNSDGSHSQPTDTTFYEIFNKLGELEDVLEKYGIETTEELDGVLKPLIDNGELENWKSATFWKMQTERLKKELAELKQKSIVLEKAFELACDPRDDWGGEKYSGTEFNNYHDYFIAEAEQKLTEIGGKDETTK